MLRARPALERLEELLLSSTPLYAEGIARLRQLLTDAGSPLYSPAHPAALADEIERALAALEGRE